MTEEMMLAFGILICTTILFAFSKMRADFIAICCLVLLVITDLLTAKEAFSGFSNSAVIMIAALFIVGAGIFQTGLASHVSRTLMNYAGKKEHSIILVTMIVSAVLSAFMSNTGTVAILLPVMLTLSRETNVSVGKLLIPLSFASSLGGSMTLIGTPPNLMVSDKLSEVELQPFSFFSYTPIGLTVLIIGIVFILFIGRKMLPNGAQSEAENRLLLKKWGKIFKIDNKVHVLRIPEKSNLKGKSVHTLNWADEFGVQVLEVERQNRNILQDPIREIAATNVYFSEADLLHLQGTKGNVQKLVNKESLEWVRGEKDSLLVNDTFGVVEFVLTPDSFLIGSNLKQVSFRKKFHLNVLSIIKNGKVYHEKLHTLRLCEGDALLLHGKWEDIESFTKKNEYGICLQLPVEERVTSSKIKMKIASVIVVGMIFALVFEWLDPVVASILAALLMVVTGCVSKTKKIYTLIDWESLILIAAMLPLSIALEKSGAVNYLSDNIVKVVGEHGPLVVLAVIYVLTNLFSQFMSNTATAVLFAPIALSAAMTLEVSPYPLLMTVAIAASMAFSTPVASPTNAMIMNIGGYKFNDFMKVGIPLQVIVGIVAIVVIPILYPF